MAKSVSTADRYNKIIEHIFFAHHTSGMTSVEFKRDEIAAAAHALGLTAPKNVGDVVYYFRFRYPLPESVIKQAPVGKEWIIRLAGRSVYRFDSVDFAWIHPTKGHAETKIPDATPGIIEMNAKLDEQALLAKLRYNRMIDIFSGVTCYSLQNHLRTTVSKLGQVETDEVYVGIDDRGAHYVFPVQAKGGKDLLSVAQIEQDFALCKQHFPNLVCRPIGAQFTPGRGIALFEFEESSGEVKLLTESHYRLVPPATLSDAELRVYASRAHTASRR